MNSSLASSADSPALAIAARYRRVVMQRYLLAGVVLLCILCSLLLDFTLGPSGISVSTLW